MGKMHSPGQRKHGSKQKPQNGRDRCTRRSEDRLVGSVLPEEMVFRWDMGMWDFEPGLLPRMLGKG